ncbi:MULTISPECIES: sensor histidine kinase [unclassified Nocardioides]|uniref:sensor histidine kinase n=1 Tax=unclassified Nocardioides TaxID=2615069 RepID=UPI0006F49D61|nr:MULTISPECIES: GAF domain-containing protein [unclassified Nocardioides]KRA32451.1 diguanylate cyclase [Nocardioides sp. Root614]KRA89104.1 diguanylate cyclase [Nocardioides sp. Root682]
MGVAGESREEPARVDLDLDRVEFEDLVRAVLDRMHGALDQQARLQLLLDAVVTISADLSLDGVLSRIVAIASRLVDAEYAALGVLSAGRRRRLRTFIHHGISDDMAAVIGELPTGHGLLGLIIDRPEPLRLHDIAEHPSSYGFPENHPPMSSFLGVPVRIRDRVFGNLYLTEKVGGGDFTVEDEEVVVALAAAAGVAIENARLYEETTTRETWSRATAAIAAAVADPESVDDAYAAVVEQAREVGRADAAWILVDGPDGDQQVVAIAGMAFSGEALASLPAADVAAQGALEKGECCAIEDITEAGGAAGIPGLPEIGPLLAVPFSPSAAVHGTLSLAWSTQNEDRYYLLDTQLVTSYAEQAALTMQLSEARDEQRRLAVFEDRDRIGRDLHDLVIQRLFAVGLGLQGATRLVERPEVAARLEQAVDDLDATIKDIRRAIFGLSSLDTAGDIQAEVTRLVERASSTLKFKPTLRFEGPVRTLVPPELAPDLLAVLAEGLSNASRHAEATAISVIVAVGDQVVLTVRDNGKGMESTGAESGLANIRIRALQRGGTLAVDSGAGRGTTLTWSVPRR